MIDDIEHLKRNLGYVVQVSSGKISSLKSVIGSEVLTDFSNLGIIQLGCYNWHKLERADRYYKDFYGYFSYLCQIINLKKKGNFIMKRIIGFFHTWLNCKASMTPTGVIPLV